MPGRLRSVVVYAKLVVVFAVAIAVIVVAFKNRHYKTKFWPGADAQEVSTLWLMLATAGAAVVVYWVLSKVRRVFADLRELQAQQARKEEDARQARARQDLEEQERRLDEKIKKALGEQPPDAD